MLPAKFKHNPRIIAASGTGARRDIGLIALELEDLPSDTWSEIRTSASRSCVNAETSQRNGSRRFILSGTDRDVRDLASRLAGAADTSYVAEEIVGTIDASSQLRFSVDFPGGVLELGSAPLIMGVLNVTPDSFSDGGLYFREQNAVERALEMIAQGADIIDVGGESTRPGAQPVSVEDELRRVLPVISGIAETTSVPISVDTYKAKVAEEALGAGAKILNDISALRFDPKMASVVADHAVPVILMHIRGTPRDMQQDPIYIDVVSEIIAYLRASLAHAIDNGIAWERTIIDPGIGFGKTVRDNLEIVTRLPEFAGLGRPVLMGTSRKSFIGKVLGLEVGDRVFGTATTVAASVLGGAHIVRVHDVAEMRQVARMAAALRSQNQPEAVAPDIVGAQKQ